MIARELVSQLIHPLRTSDTGEQALTYMQVYHLKHMPIVNNEQLLGTISEEDITTSPLDESIGSFSLGLNRAFVKDADHLFEVMSVMADHKLTAVPVVDVRGTYVGLITLEDLIQFYARSFSFSEPGGIIVIELAKSDYSLAEISRIIESEHATILSSFLTQDEESGKMYVTLKTNQTDTQHLQATLERFGYTIKATFSEEGYFESLQDHYEAFLHYLNV
ncbi:MAG TPA: CBS domain-containing protein [Saprospiraceae bacterium]|nr:CBS domain-containing protein [Saprospiraceae bacterium]